MKINRNDKCPCDSGKKFKKCHIFTDSGKAITQNFGQPFIDYHINIMKKESEQK